MKRTSLLLPLVASIAIAAAIAVPSRAAETPPAGSEDPKANAVAERVMQALGGQKAFDDARFLRFRFAGFRNHWWDKHTGRHRVEFTNRGGEHFVFLENVNTREGRGWKNGVEITGPEAKEGLDRAYGTWINDTYWLLAPYKLRDPGTHLAYDGEETLDGTVYDKLRLSFDNVGLTPKDRYWFWVNRETGLVDRWAYILQDYPADRPATAWKWTDWKPYGGIMLASGRLEVSEGRQLPLDSIAVESEMADSIFTSPDRLVAPPEPAPKP